MSSRNEYTNPTETIQTTLADLLVALQEATDDDSLVLAAALDMLSRSRYENKPVLVCVHGCEQAA
jgi:hypothetical protein